MPSLAEWKLIGITLIATFYISAALYVIMCKFAIRLRNKTKRNKTRKVDCSRTKNTFKIDYYKFVSLNFKKQEYLFENKNRVAELVRLVNY